MATTTLPTADCLKYAELQMAAEACLVNESDGRIRADPRQALIDGNLRGMGFTGLQASRFAEHWIVLEQTAATTADFGGTLFQCIRDDSATHAKAGELVMSFRSIEFIDHVAGDKQANNTLEIEPIGSAWGRICGMEAWYRDLKDRELLRPGQGFAVTGCGLGAHLAEVFGVLHGPKAPANIEHLWLTGSNNIDATGNELANVLTGNASNNTLTGNAGNDALVGGAGADVMVGGLGNDIYYVDNGADVVIELAGEGSDAVRSTITYTLGADLENLVLDSAAAIDGTGNTLDNTLYAGAGNNVLDGLDGSDTASYLFARSAVSVSLATTGAQATGGAGIDTLLNMENLTGSNYDDVLVGSPVANVLDGGLGKDTLMGGAGNDMYFVDSSADLVIELADQGNDTVRTSITYTLPANAENLMLGTTASIDGTGNALANVLYAGAGDNVLDGQAGNDWVSYVYARSGVTVGLASDGAQATGGSGTDTLRNVECLFGSNYDDVLTGSSTSNALSGGLGNDTLTGGEAADTLNGGAGNDTYRYRSGDGNDAVFDQGGDDTVELPDLKPGDVRIVQGSHGNDDLIVDRRTGQSITLDLNLVSPGWMEDGSRIEHLRFSDGTVWNNEQMRAAAALERQVQLMVQATATFSVPAAGSVTLAPPEDQARLAPTLAASWG